MENRHKQTSVEKALESRPIKFASMHLMLDYAKRKKSNIIIRGLRAVSDFEFEFQRALMNRKVNREIETVFIMTKGSYVFLDSSIIKEMSMFGGCVKGLVPGIVEKKLKEKLHP